MEQRELKFRAYWPNTKEMRYFEPHHFVDSPAGWLMSFRLSENQNKDIYFGKAEIMQYIGVKGYEGDYESRHQNEVELYEGDIVEAMSEGSKGRFVIKFRNEGAPCFMLFPAWQNGKMWSIAASDLGRAKGDYYDDLRRIGNVYQNPELSTVNQYYWNR